MYTPYKRFTDSKLDYFLIYLISIALFIFSNVTYATTDIVIDGRQVIDKPTSFSNVVIDMTHGRFKIVKGGSLKIENSTINSNLYFDNPYTIDLEHGSLFLKNNKINIDASMIKSNKLGLAKHEVFKVNKGKVELIQNDIWVNTSYSVGLLNTTDTETSGLKLSNNTIKNFHGGFNITNANNTEIIGNIFENVSSININVVNTTNATKIQNNIFYFPGNLVAGDAIDVINSSGVTISDNIVASSANYGIYIMGGQNIFIDNNKISDGYGYGIYIDTPSSIAKAVSKMNYMANSNIVISNNYLAQNRYGLSGGVVDNLIVSNNFFIQRFIDNTTRQYWTNNDNLLPLATNLTWLNNLYKEAFTQEVPGDNSNTLKFVSFPRSGGVLLP